MCWKRNGRNKENNDSSALSKQYCLIGTKIVNLFFLIFRPCCKRRIKPTTISKVFHCFALQRLWYFHLIFLAMFEICNFSLDFFSLFSLRDNIPQTKLRFFETILVDQGGFRQLVGSPTLAITGFIHCTLRRCYWSPSISSKHSFFSLFFSLFFAPML